jgi:peptidoglycan/LPS O-acetylase OafA/YrhL
MTPGKKYTLMTSGFYLLLFALVPLLERYSPSGPCNPGAGMLLIMLIPLLSGLGFVVSFAFRVKGKRAFMGPAIVNGTFFVGSLALFYLGRQL